MNRCDEPRSSTAMHAKAAATCAVATSAIVVVVCLMATAYMFADMNDFYDEAMSDMNEFEVCCLLLPLSL